MLYYITLFIVLFSVFCLLDGLLASKLPKVRGRYLVAGDGLYYEDVNKQLWKYNEDAACWVTQINPPEGL